MVLGNPFNAPIITTCNPVMFVNIYNTNLLVWLILEFNVEPMLTIIIGFGGTNNYLDIVSRYGKYK